MGRTSSGLDNAVAASFNSTLEFELLAGAGRYVTRAPARTAVAAFIDGYNHSGGTRPQDGSHQRSTRPGFAPNRLRHEGPEKEAATPPRVPTPPRSKNCKIKVSTVPGDCQTSTCRSRELASIIAW
jgi:hypothetical protein